jgi:hypothetical protein
MPGSTYIVYKVYVGVDRGLMHGKIRHPPITTRRHLVVDGLEPVFGVSLGNASMTNIKALFAKAKQQDSFFLNNFGGRTLDRVARELKLPSKVPYSEREGYDGHRAHRGTKPSGSESVQRFRHKHHAMVVHGLGDFMLCGAVSCAYKSCSFKHLGKHRITHNPARRPTCSGEARRCTGCTVA